jgi:hypothetical protein
VLFFDRLFLAVLVSAAELSVGSALVLFFARLFFVEVVSAPLAAVSAVSAVASFLERVLFVVFADSSEEGVSEPAAAFFVALDLDVVAESALTSVLL